MSLMEWPTAATELMCWARAVVATWKDIETETERDRERDRQIKLDRQKKTNTQKELIERQMQKYKD